MERTILGIHGDIFNPAGKVHESSAAIVRDGKLLSAISEERITRKKTDGSFPVNAIEENLKVSNTDFEDISQIALASLHPKQNAWKYFKSALSTFIDTDVILKEKLKLFGWAWIYHSLKTKGKFEYERNGYKVPVYFIEHHLGHAASAYYTSPFDKALVITLDGGGDGLDGSAYYGEGTALKKVSEIPHYQSPGTMYSAITYDLGFKRHRHEGKITGLAAYGNPDAVSAEIESLIRYDNKKHRFISRPIASHHKDLLAPSGYFGPLLQKYSREDIAAAVQQKFEEVTIQYINDAFESIRKKGYQPENICLAGGCFANVKLNQRIIEAGNFKNIFIFPAMGDEGLSAGAGLYLNYQLTKDKNKSRSSIHDVYLGGAFSDEKIKEALEKKGLKYEKPADLEKETGKKLAEGKVVARYNGRMEYGPRALGNRSILGAPFDPDINNWLNKKLNRTEFMPFAPSILAEFADEYFEGYHRDHVAADFMTITYNVKDEVKDRIPAVVHVDKTARPQVVKRDVNNSFYRIIEAFYHITNVPVVLNTSFNIHEEPIVYTPEDAIRGFLQAKLDYLAIGPFLVKGSINE